MGAKTKHVAKDIGLIEMCFSGHHQDKPYQRIETGLLNSLFFTIKEQKKLIEYQAEEIRMQGDEIADLNEQLKTI